MSISSPDPSRGFVALPLEILEIPMSPGAFRTLAEFCRMADRDGYCWPSLEQLGARLGRSRAAVSGYVKELRALSLLTTQEQRMANGYNYRLKYLVTFWKSWRAAFGKVPNCARSETERSVKPAERPKGKNQNHSNQVRAARTYSELSDLHKTWKRHVGNAPFPSLQSSPSAALIRETKAALATAVPEAPGDPERVLKDFFASMGIAPDPHWMAEIRTTVRAASLPDAFLLAALRAAWKPHWRRPPAPVFVEKLMAEAAQRHPDPALQRLLSGYLRRWERHSQRLSSAPEACNA